eukprot:CAMPEP_0180221430 /NCGR_PEP_ID=MMETSP0987-20121128/19871_1 /TAXON_ID=697907 /ORGANISM="non described non described, Strain CCMP2293" /LENGTH=104 /DNA_ID=CAMNT_0022182847 /DNA_START=1 /DNA_END=315 /DNA_ORIENTATION=-
MRWSLREVFGKMLSCLLFSKMNFTGMGGPMGAYDDYDTDICNDGGTHCVARDNEGYYGKFMSGAGAGGKGGAGGICPAAFDCVGLPAELWHPLDGHTNAVEYIE